MVEGLINGRTPEEIKEDLETVVKINEFTNLVLGVQNNATVDIVRDTLEYIAELEAVRPRWIMAEKQLPEVDPERVYGKDTYSADLVVWGRGQIRTAYYHHNRDEWHDSYFEDEIIDVKYWMLPVLKPPEEGANE